MEKIIELYEIGKLLFRTLMVKPNYNLGPELEL